MISSRKIAARFLGVCCIAGLAGLVLSLPFAGLKALEASNTQPLVLAKMGAFYAGGHYDKAHPEQHIVGQIYVEYQIPAIRQHPFPIVMVHGGGQTGAG